MIPRRNVAHAVPLCAALYLCSGCAGQQMLAIKDRDIRDLRQQNASRQEALVKALKTIESVRAELGASRYERRELEQKDARNSASIRLQQQTIDRLETQKAKLLEQLRQSEIAYERLKHTYQDIKAVLNNTVTDLAQTRLERVLTPGDSRSSGQSTGEHSRLRRKVDELRSQVIRERAKRRAGTADQALAAPTPAPPSEDSSPWIWRLTEEPPEVETIEPGSLVIDEGAESKTASNSDEPHVLGTAFLWTLGAIPAIGLTLLMFIILVRVLNRTNRDTREAHEESSPIDDYEEEDDQQPLEDEAYEDHDEVAAEAEREDSDERAVGLDRDPPVDETREVEETETRPADASRSSSSTTEEESPADTTFIDSLDWLDDTARTPERRPKHAHAQDTDALQLAASSDREEPRARTEPVTPAPKPTKRRHEPRETEHGNSDTQMIEKIDADELGVTQVLTVLGGKAADDSDPDTTDLDESRNQEFTETSVLDAAGVSAATSSPPEESQGLDELATDTQILPPLVDFEEDSELDEALAATVTTDEEDESLDQDGDSDSELLAELEDLMGEKFEEPVA